MYQSLLPRVRTEDMMIYRKIISKALVVGALLISAPVFAGNYYLTEGNAREGYIKIELELIPGLVADILGDRWLMTAKNLQHIDGISNKYINLVIYNLRRQDELGTELFLADAEPGLAPVFKDIGGNYQIVTGRVRVVFSLELNQEQVRGFFEDFGITKFSKLSWQDNGYEVAVAPGLPALELADRLRIMPQVLETYPDIWMNRYSIQ